MTTIHLPAPIHQSGIDRLTQLGTLTLGYGPHAIPWIEALENAEALVLRGAVGVTPADLAIAPKLQLIVRHGVGVENIDIDAASEHNVAVMNTPAANFQSVAEQALGAMIALSRRMLEADSWTKNGQFQKRDELLATELSGKTLGIIGYGRIGRKLGEMCRLALAMKVLCYDPFLPASAVDPSEATRTESLHALMQQSDVVSIHTPLTPETRHLVGADELAAMRPTAYLLNLSRGGTVDESALYDALKNSVIKGAALDVFETEPPPIDHPLFTLPNVIVTPHLGAQTEEAFQRMAEHAAEATAAWFERRKPQVEIGFLNRNEINEV